MRVSQRLRRLWPWVGVSSALAFLWGLPGHLDDTWAWMGWLQIKELQIVVSYVALVVLVIYLVLVVQAGGEPYRSWLGRVRERASNRVPVEFGVVGKPPEVQWLRLGHQSILIFPVGSVRRFIEIDGAYCVDVIHPALQATFDEVSCTRAVRRRYEDFGASWDHPGYSRTEPKRLNLQVVVRRADA